MAIILDLMRLRKQFNKVIFIDKTHRYVDLDGNEYRSVTSIKKTFFKPFDSEYHLERISKRDGIPKSLLSDRWDEKRIIGTERGSLIHKYLENLVNNKVIDIPLVYEGMANMKYQCKKFISTIRKRQWIPIAQEMIVYDEDTKIAGQVDALFAKDNAIILVDYKTDSKSYDELTAHYGKYLKEPFNTIKASILNGYYLQVNMYRALLEKKGFPVYSMYIVHFKYNDTEYGMYEVPIIDIDIDSL